MSAKGEVGEREDGPADPDRSADGHDGDGGPAGAARPAGFGDDPEELLGRVREGGAVPAHVAIIMDGNGRWARDRGLPRWEGHRRGMESVRESVKAALEAGVDHLTLYAFSQENWRRPDEEIEALMALLEEFVEREKEELLDQGVRARVFGELDHLPDSALAAVEELQSHTRQADRLHLNLAVSYGARAEIVQAARKLARKAVLGTLRPADVDEERFARELYTAGWPDPDLLVRTSGEMRLSNFLLWQVAYAELHVTPVLWPEFGRAAFHRALLEYQGRERRFGRVEA